MGNHFQNRLVINLKDEDTKNKGRVIAKSPMEHQKAVHAKMNQFFNDAGKHGVVVMPTGSGKTYTTIYWLLKHVVAQNKKVLWLADQGFLIEQAYEEFRKNILEISPSQRTEIRLNIVSGSPKHGNTNSIDINDDLLFVTSQTAISNWEDKSLSKDVTPFQKFIEHNHKDLFIVYDEAHHTPAFGRRNLLIGGSEGKTGIIEKFPHIPLLGLTATPTYTDSKKIGWLWKIFKDGVIHEINKKELEDKKILASPDFQQISTNLDFTISDAEVERVVIKHQDLPNHIIESLAKNETRNQFIADYYNQKSATLGKTIIYLDRWYQCQMVEDLINKKAGKTIAASVFSYVDSNKNVDYINNRTNSINDDNLAKFKTGELQVLLNVKMLTEGVDVPDVKSVIITRETNSTILFTQMVGRALRGEAVGGGKTTANIILFTDNWNKHVLFAQNRFVGGNEDSSITERGHRPMELINIDLLKNLDLAMTTNNYLVSINEMMPIGWYVVEYSDEYVDEDDINQRETQEFKENVIVSEADKQLVEAFIENYQISSNWEKEDFNYEEAEKVVRESSSSDDKSLLTKLIQIGRHLGQKDTTPFYFTFEQKSSINIMALVEEVRGKEMSDNEKEVFLKNYYHESEISNPFLKLVFPDLGRFYDAYEFENKVFRNRKEQQQSISIPDQTISKTRLANEVRAKVFERDGHMCVCCGAAKGAHLQIDHIIAYKHQEPDNDNPALYQTLCKVCNGFKSSYSYDYRNLTNVTLTEWKIDDKTPLARGEKQIQFLNRLINTSYKFGAVHLQHTEAIDHGNAIWKVKVKRGLNPQENVIKDKEHLIQIIKSKGFSLKDLVIEEL